ncbi:family 1 glycosylhydrolase [Desertivirga arenae]|uniref:family 1 glycosylhydrolase n=1 Tax=Desertivirga arenae TaxID=2810309 RepID=UPI001A96542C|nr:family 1 glycosylhydrolase [Pedobacter sp. SYSU D00823]
MTDYNSIFPTFFISGFECSTFIWKDQGRRNLIAETQHDQFLKEDYGLLHRLGIAVSREGIPWPLVDRAGYFDFSMLDPVIEVLNEYKISPIWDLCHYGYPDNLDPFSESFCERFEEYCKAATKYISERLNTTSYFTPINEITFFSYAGGEWGWIAPHKKTREDRFSLRKNLCKAAIMAAKAIREVMPEARMVHMDPLVQVVAPLDRPELKAAAAFETYADTFVAWDILCGKLHPEFGGSPEILDIVGLNNYSFGQMEFRENGPHQALDPQDDRIVSLCELIHFAWQRYKRPVIISETSGMKDGRDAWLKDVMEESLAAVDLGIDLQGVCLFPAVDMQDWHTGEWLNNGICDLVNENGRLKRVPYEPYIQEIRRWQKELNRVTELDEDPYSDPVNLDDIQEAAKRLNIKPDENWS